MPSAFERSRRGFLRSSRPASSAIRTFSSALTLNPGTSRRRSCSTAARRSSSDFTPISSNSLRAFFGPKPGSRVISTRPGGYFALSLSALGIVPVSSSVSIFSAIVLPIPGSFVTVPARLISSIDAVASRIAFAALR